MRHVPTWIRLMTAAREGARHPLLREPVSVRWAPYVWLVYLPALFIAPLVNHSGLEIWMPAIGAVLVFVPLYLYAYALDGHTSVERIIVLMALLGLLLTPGNATASVFMVYAASLAGMIRRPRRAVAGLFLLLAAIAIEAVLTHTSLAIWGGESFFVAAVGAANAHFVTVQDVEGNLRRAREEIAQLAVLRERERIARDLHDVLGHTLSLITLKAALAERLVASDAAVAQQELRDIGEISRGALDEVRSAVTGYLQTGLAAELAAARVMLDAAGVQTEVEAWKASLSDDEDAALALVLREAATNVARHAQAHTCVIRLREVDRTRLLEVIDDGIGTSAQLLAGNGVNGMRTRVEALRGVLRIEQPQDGRGWHVSAALPA